MSLLWLKVRICSNCKKDYQPTGSKQRFCKSCGIENEKEKDRLYQMTPKRVLWRKTYEETETRNKTYIKYRNTEKYRKYGRKRYYEMDENKRKAGYYMSNAIRDKRLIKAKSCEECGGNEVRIEGHHYKGYEPENWLEIKWLDVPCHKKAHLRGRVSEA